MRAAVIGSEPMVRKRLPIATPRVGGTLLLALIIVSAPLWMANNYAYDVAIQVASMSPQYLLKSRSMPWCVSA